MGLGAHDRRSNVVACTPSVNPDAEPELLYLHALFALKDAKLGIIESAAHSYGLSLSFFGCNTTHNGNSACRALSITAVVPTSPAAPRPWLHNGCWPAQAVRTPRLVPR